MYVCIYVYHFVLSVYRKKIITLSTSLRETSNKSSVTTCPNWNLRFLGLNSGYTRLQNAVDSPGRIPWCAVSSIFTSALDASTNFKLGSNFCIWASIILGNNSLKLGNDMFFSEVCKIMVRQATVYKINLCWIINKIKNIFFK